MILFILFNLYAAETIVYGDYEFIELNDGRVVSKHCEKADCLAKTIQIKNVQSFDGEDPVGVACLEVFQGRPFNVRSKKGNQVGLCELDDKSMITFGSIRALLVEIE